MDGSSSLLITFLLSTAIPTAWEPTLELDLILFNTWLAVELNETWWSKYSEAS